MHRPRTLATPLAPRPPGARRPERRAPHPQHAPPPAACSKPHSPVLAWQALPYQESFVGALPSGAGRQAAERGGFAFNLHERSGKHVFDQMGLGRATHTEEENDIISPEEQGKQARAETLFAGDDVRKEIVGTPPRSRSPFVAFGARMFQIGRETSAGRVGQMHSSQI